MFMPQENVSEAELREAEKTANLNVQFWVATCAALWFSPHVVDWASRLF